MSYTEFIKPYPDGYVDGESGGTPVTASILNTNYDGFLLALNEFLPELEGRVEANPSGSATAGDLTKLKVGNSIYLIPSGGSGGSTVSWEQIQQSGTKIATITIDNVPVDVYAPSGGGSGDEVSWTQVLGSGTKIGTITINGTPTDVYAPTPIDVEANPSGTATAGDLTKLKVGSSIYSIPSGGSGGASDLSDLGDVTITNVQNGQIIKWNSTTSKWENVNDTGGGSGHTILDDDGTALVQEDNLQFVGVYSEDDSTDEATKVNIYREMTKTEFDLLSSDEKKGFIRVTDEPDIYSDGHFQPVIYSTEEREIGVWTDGKPLYEKTFLFDYNDLQNETYGKYINLSIPNIDKSCLFTISIEDGQLILPYYQGASLYIIAFPILSTDVCKFSFRYGSEVSSQISSFFTDCKIILRYTKTTDVAGSGSWTPQGVPTHKYSTEEHVVGTWIDGSTLYEKTIDYTVNKSTSHTFNFADGNAKRVVDGFIINSLNNICFPVNCSWESKTEEFLYDETHFYINTSANIGNSSTLRIIVHYTKSS